MSGPKDYAFRFAVARLQRIRARMEAERMARAAVVRNLLSKQKDVAMARMKASQSSRAAAIQSELEKRKQAALEARNQVTSGNANVGSVPAMQTDKIDIPLTMESAPVARSEAIEPLMAEKAFVAGGEPATAELHNQLGEIRGWTEAMQADRTVNDFRSAAVAEWRKQAESLLADSNAGQSTVEMHARCDTVLNDVQRIFDEAGELKGKFDTRNELLADIIASFKEIGFHVSDPFFEHPDDPTGPAILKASCGSETVTASIDLSTTVRSVWDGVESEQCKDAFFAYVDRMKQRGVDVEPDRLDLRERPKLLQKGANELPRTHSNTAGE